MKERTKILVLGVLAFASTLIFTVHPTRTNDCVERELFMQCLDHAPSGAAWAVRDCHDFAYIQAQTTGEVPKNCTVNKD
jgi:hypothetical protein